MAKPRISDATQRIARRKRGRRLRRLRAVGIAALVLAVVIGAGWLVGFSSVFTVTQVTVTGNSLVGADTIKSVAAVPMGTALVFTDPNPIAGRIADLPEVRTVTVSRAWPNSIRIEVKERTAVYAIRTSAGDYWLVDEAGITYHTEASKPKELLQVHAATLDIPVLRDVGIVVKSLPDQLRQRVTAIHVMSGDNIVLSLSGGAQVVWGSAQESELKGQVAQALLKVKAKIYDVSAPANPVTKP